METAIDLQEGAFSPRRPSALRCNTQRTPQQVHQVISLERAISFGSEEKRKKEVAECLGISPKAPFLKVRNDGRVEIHCSMDIGANSEIPVGVIFMKDVVLEEGYFNNELPADLEILGFLRLNEEMTRLHFDEESIIFPFPEGVTKVQRHISRQSLSA